LDASPFTWRLLGALFVMYVVQVLVDRWVVPGLSANGASILELLAWWGMETERFQPWQPATSFLLQGPGPTDAFFDWLALLFLFPPVERTHGRRATLRLMGLAILLAILGGVGLNALGAVYGSAPVLGYTPAYLALLIVFCLSHPDAVIRLFFILPIPAMWIGWGTTILTFLAFLYFRSIDSAAALCGVAMGWIWMQPGLGGFLRRWEARNRNREVQERLRRFEVFEGGAPREPQRRRRDDDPMIH
jgi:membrane associated rhomboid family serine protease